MTAHLFQQNSYHWDEHSPFHSYFKIRQNVIHNSQFLPFVTSCHSSALFKHPSTLRLHLSIRKIRASSYHYQHSFLTVPIIITNRTYILRVPFVGIMKGNLRPRGDLLFFHYQVFKLNTSTLLGWRMSSFSSALKSSYGLAWASKRKYFFHESQYTNIKTEDISLNVEDMCTG